jgi:hypothetical protein
MSTLRTNTLTDAAGGNSMPVADINQGRAKSWFNLNGTGTIAARDTFNITSFTDNGTGDYSAFFITAAANANYTFTANAGGTSTAVIGAPGDLSTARTINGRRMFALTVAAALIDAANVDSTQFGDQ